MFGMIDLKDVQPSSTDLRELRWLLRQLIAEPFLFFRVSYGDELTLHLGAPRESSGHDPRMQHRRRGSYVVGARASAWFLRAASPLLLIGVEDGETDAPARLKKLDVKDLESGEFIRPGAALVDATAIPTPLGFALLLSFSDGSVLRIVPSPSRGDEDGDEEVADWEVFTPHDRYLRAGPGLRWAYLPSDGKTDPATEGPTPVA